MNGSSFGETSFRFGDFASVAFASAGVVDIIAPGTTPILGTRDKSLWMVRFLAPLTILPPLEIGEGAFSAQPLHGLLQAGVLFEALFGA